MTGAARLCNLPHPLGIWIGTPESQILPFKIDPAQLPFPLRDRPRSFPPISVIPAVFWQLSALSYNWALNYVQLYICSCHVRPVWPLLNQNQHFFVAVVISLFTSDKTFTEHLLRQAPFQALRMQRWLRQNELSFKTTSETLFPSAVPWPRCSVQVLAQLLRYAFLHGQCSSRCHRDLSLNSQITAVLRSLGQVLSSLTRPAPSTDMCPSWPRGVLT